MPPAERDRAAEAWGDEVAPSSIGLHLRAGAEVASRSHPMIDATYMAVNPDERRPLRDEGNQQVVVEMARAAWTAKRNEFYERLDKVTLTGLGLD